MWFLFPAHQGIFPGTCMKVFSHHIIRIEDRNYLLFGIKARSNRVHSHFLIKGCWCQFGLFFSAAGVKDEHCKGRRQAFNDEVIICSCFHFYYFFGRHLDRNAVKWRDLSRDRFLDFVTLHSK
ncbi:hypothetical protein DRW42_26160 [Pedobacter miscanthi]|uniref:Uncharacterized protein n=1 Tax=Pedobacter miscanthi TaxID=2259170 RepID=A0A366KN13_9SPHI|nr:hypothetical protein DRW42_26160 [Pedobacter miscanthi]